MNSCSSAVRFVSLYLGVRQFVVWGQGPVLAASIATYIHRFPIIFLQPPLFWLMPQYHPSDRRFPAIIRPFTLYHGIGHIHQFCVLLMYSNSKLGKGFDCFFGQLCNFMKDPGGSLGVFSIHRLCAGPKNLQIFN